MPFLLYRAITEDRILQADLPGYRDYAARVRWRLPAGIVRAGRDLADAAQHGPDA